MGCRRALCLPHLYSSPPNPTGNDSAVPSTGPVPPPGCSGPTNATVTSGTSLGSIAEQYQVSIADVQSANGLNCLTPLVNNQKLRVDCRLGNWSKPFGPGPAAGPTGGCTNGKSDWPMAYVCPDGAYAVQFTVYLSAVSGPSRPQRAPREPCLRVVPDDLQCIPLSRHHRSGAFLIHRPAPLPQPPSLVLAATGDHPAIGAIQMACSDGTTNDRPYTIGENTATYLQQPKGSVASMAGAHAPSAWASCLLTRARAQVPGLLWAAHIDPPLHPSRFQDSRRFLSDRTVPICTSSPASAPPLAIWNRCSVLRERWCSGSPLASTRSSAVETR